MEKTRQYDTDEELIGERPAGQKRARKLHKEEEEREAVKARNLRSDRLRAGEVHRTSCPAPPEY